MFSNKIALKIHKKATYFSLWQLFLKRPKKPVKIIHDFVSTFTKFFFDVEKIKMDIFIKKRCKMKKYLHNVSKFFEKNGYQKSFM